MSKKNTRNRRSKRNRRINPVENFFKIFGICLGSMIGFVLLVVGGVWVTGGFNPPPIPPNDFTFEFNDKIAEKNTIELNKEDEFIIRPIPEDATEMDIELKIDSGADIISFSGEQKLNTPIKIIPSKDKNGKIKGGVARVRVSSVAAQKYGEFIVKVDCPVESFRIKSTVDDDFGNAKEIFIGSKFKVFADDFFPAQSYSPYEGLKKKIEYASSNAIVADVDEKTGEVVVNSSGEFDISCYVYKTFYDQDNNLMGNKLEIKRKFKVSNKKVGSISVAGETFSLGLHQTRNFGINRDFKLTLNAPEGSSILQAELDTLRKYVRFYPVEQKAGKYYIRNDFLSLNKIGDSTLQVKVLKYFADERTPGIIARYVDEVNYKEFTEEQLLGINGIELDDVTKFLQIHINYVGANLAIIGNNQNSEGIFLEYKTANDGDTYDLNKHYTLNDDSSYKAVKFFVSANDLDSNKSIDYDIEEKFISINGDVYYEICHEQKYGLISPLTEGRVTIYAAVMETDINGNFMMDMYNDKQYNFIANSKPMNVVVSQKIDNIEAKIYTTNSFDKVEIEKNGGHYYLSGGKTYYVELYVNKSPDEIYLDTENSNNANNILNAYLYKQLFFQSNAEENLAVMVDKTENGLLIQLETRKSGAATFRVQYSGSTDIVKEYDIVIDANTITELEILPNGTRVMATFENIDKNYTIKWYLKDELTQGGVPSVGNAKQEFNATFIAYPAGLNTDGVVIKSGDSKILEVVMDEENTPHFNFKKAGVVDIWAEVQVSENELVKSPGVRITVEVPDINVTCKTFEFNDAQAIKLLGNHDINDNIMEVRINGELKSDGSGVRFEVLGKDGGNKIAKFRVDEPYTLDVSRVETKKNVYLRAYFDQLEYEKEICIQINVTIGVEITYPNASEVEEVYAGETIDLLGKVLPGEIARVKFYSLLDPSIDYVHNFDGGKPQIDYVIESPIFKVEKRHILKVHEHATERKTVYIQIRMKISKGNEEDRFFQARYRITIVPKININTDFKGNKVDHNYTGDGNIDYLNVYAGANYNLRQNVSILRGPLKKTTASDAFDQVYDKITINRDLLSWEKVTISEFDSPTFIIYNAFGEEVDESKSIISLDNGTKITLKKNGDLSVSSSLPREMKLDVQVEYMGNFHIIHLILRKMKITVNYDETSIFKINDNIYQNLVDGRSNIFGNKIIYEIDNIVSLGENKIDWKLILQYSSDVNVNLVNYTIVKEEERYVVKHKVKGTEYLSIYNDGTIDFNSSLVEEDLLLTLNVAYGNNNVDMNFGYQVVD